MNRVPLTALGAVDQAEQLLDALLPRDGRWHPCGPLLGAGLAHGLPTRTVQRAVERLGIERHRTREFGARVEWRWSAGTAAGSTPQREIDLAWREIERAQAALISTGATGATGDNFRGRKRAA